MQGALARSSTQRKGTGNAADVISSDASRRSINIYSSLNAPVVAVNDGVIKKIGDNPKLGHYIVLQDAYGNQYIQLASGQLFQVTFGTALTGGTAIWIYAICQDF